MNSESPDTKILKVLNEYYKKNPGDPEINVNELFAKIPEISQPALLGELAKLQEKKWIHHELTQDGRSGLVWIEPKGRKVLISWQQNHHKEPVIPTSQTKPQQALIPKYAYDIFVGYAIEDSQQQNWISRTIENLKKLLEVKYSLHHQFPLWVEHAECTAEAINDVRHSAIFLIFLSKNYVNSPWCQPEDRRFLHVIQERVNDGSKIFLVAMDNAGRPEQFSRSVDYQFWITYNEEPFVRTLALNENSAEDDFQRYQTQLWQVGDDVYKELHQLKKRSEIRQKLEHTGVLIDNHDVDKVLSHRVAKKLDAYGVGYIFPYLSSKRLPSEVKNEFENTIINCEGLLIIYGEASGQWLIEEVNKMRGIFVKHGKHQPKAYAIYNGPPEANLLPEPFKFPGIILDCRTCQQLDQGCYQCASEKDFLQFIEYLK